MQGVSRAFQELTNLRTNEHVNVLWTPSMNCIPPSPGGACLLRAASSLPPTVPSLPLHVCCDSQVLINYGGLSALDTTVFSVAMAAAALASCQAHLPDKHT